MISQVFKRSPDVAHFANIALGQCSLDLTSRLPDRDMGGWLASLSASYLCGANAWQVGDPAKRSKNIRCITTGMAGHEDAAIALPDRE